MNRTYFHERRWLLPLLILGVGGISWILLYHLGSLTGGLSSGEQQAATGLYGWHGLYQQPFYLPLKVVRSMAFVGVTHHGQTLTRLPNALFGALTIACFAWLLRCWYAGRTALLTALLFACSAWVLHVSRLASYDTLYLLALPGLMLAQCALQRRPESPLVFYGSLLVWTMLLYIPGVVWLLLASLVWTTPAWLKAWGNFNRWWQRTLYCVLALVVLSLLVKTLLQLTNLRLWAGLPAHFAAPLPLLKQFGAVPVHLLVRGPAYSALWLGRAPLLDIFVLAMTLLGVYFYARHLRAPRSQALLCYFLIGWLLVGLGGPVGLSLLVPLLYLCAAAGIAYLLREWFRVFPYNPIARGLGLSLIVLAVIFSCGYNLRAYFVAWPHDPQTQVTFRYRR